MDSLHRHNFREGATAEAVVTRFAYQIVSQMARNTGIETGMPGRELLQLMVRMARTGDPAVLERIFLEMKRHRVSAEQMIDIYLPATVSRIGASWHDGEMDVLHATIACARLQNVLREFSRAWFADRGGYSSGARVLLAMPRDEVHTLGAMIAAHQMRRLGVSVRVELLPTAPNVETLLETQHFNAVFLSVSNLSSLETAAELVKTVRRTNACAIPVVIGGAAAFPERVGLTNEEVTIFTGADMVTADVSAALASLGLLGIARAAE